MILNNTCVKPNSFIQMIQVMDFYGHQKGHLHPLNWFEVFILLSNIMWSISIWFFHQSVRQTPTGTHSSQVDQKN